jgi:hypothetical protein
MTSTNLKSGDKITVVQNGKKILGVVTKVIDGVIHWKSRKQNAKKA